MKPSEKLTLVFVAFCAVNLLGVIMGLSSWSTNASEYKHIMLFSNCIGFVAFSVLSAKYLIESCRPTK